MRFPQMIFCVNVNVSDLQLLARGSSYGDGAPSASSQKKKKRLMNPNASIGIEFGIWVHFCGGGVNMAKAFFLTRFKR